MTAPPGQMSLLDAMRAPPIIEPVDPRGSVVQGDVCETLTLPHPRLAWALARIELHRHTDGRWMWGVSHPGGGYKVGPKWGRFAETRDDALYWAIDELLGLIGGRSCASLGITATHLSSVRKWAEGLRP